jgi:hypothetical protein
MSSYTYLIGWSEYDLWYYGSRYSKKADPTDLWVNYFTSSKFVKIARHILGEPNVIEVRMVFDNTSKARLWESKVLRRLKCVKSQRWLNRGSTGKDFLCTSHSQETREKISKALKGRKTSEKVKDRIGGLNRGRKFSDSERKAISDACLGRKPWNAGRTGVYSEETLAKMRRTYSFVNPEGVTIKVQNLTQFCQDNNLNKNSMKRVDQGKQKSHNGYTKHILKPYTGETY